MNRNRLSTSLGTAINIERLDPKINRELLDQKINRLLRELSNIEIKQGSKYIKNLKKHLPVNGRNYEKFNHAVQVLDADTGSVLYDFESTRSCARFLGLASSSTTRYLKSGKRFLFENSLVYIKKLEATDMELEATDME